MAICPIDLKLSENVFENIYNLKHAENRSFKYYPERDSRTTHFLLLGQVSCASVFREGFH